MSRNRITRLFAVALLTVALTMAASTAALAGSRGQTDQGTIAKNQKVAIGQMRPAVPSGIGLVSDFLPKWDGHEWDYFWIWYYLYYYLKF